MKAWLPVNNAAHQIEHAAWMREGLGRHGIEVEFAARNTFGPCDFAIIWGWRQQATVAAARERGVPVLVMERGHLQPRMQWTSLGWNGLAGRGTYPQVADCGARFRRHFAHLLRGWRQDGETALILGQIPGDMALRGIDMRAWATDRATALAALGHDRIVYRPHPRLRETRDNWCPQGAALSRADGLADDLAAACLAVSYSSTSGVEAVLAGVPHVAHDEGSMAWPVSAHGDDSLELRPGRSAWAWALAWTQWQEDELRDGTAWEVVRTCVDL